jgi:hypothetical protein
VIHDSSAFLLSDAGVLNDSVIEYYGNPATYYPQTGAPFVVTAIFSSPNQREATAYQGTYHDMFARASDFYQPPVAGDTVEVFNQSWRVFDITNDFGGAYKLTLQRNLCR